MFCTRPARRTSSDSSRVFDLGQVYPLALPGGAGGRVCEELHAIAVVKSGMHSGLALQAFAEAFQEDSADPGGGGSIHLKRAIAPKIRVWDSRHRGRRYPLETPPPTRYDFCVSYTRAQQRKIFFYRVLKGLLTLAVVWGLLFWFEPYTCRDCKEAGETPGFIEGVKCEACGGDGAVSIGNNSGKPVMSAMRLDADLSGKVLGAPRVYLHPAHGLSTVVP